MFNKTIECSLAQPPEHIHDTSPECHTKAITRLHDIKTHLDDACMIALINLFKADTAEADTYMTLQHDVLRKKWLNKQLFKHSGFPATVEPVVQ